MSKPDECSSGFLSGLLGGGGGDTGSSGEDTETVETATDTSETSDGDDLFADDDLPAWDEEDLPAWDRRKRSVRCKRETQEEQEQEIELPNVDLRTLDFSTIESLEK